MELEDIKKELVDACLLQTPKNFIPFLMCDNVITRMPNKTRFYSFLEHMIKCAKENSVGKWTLRIEKANWINEENTLAYNFYDEGHIHARLCILITETENELLIETMPF